MSSSTPASKHASSRRRFTRILAGLVLALGIGVGGASCTSALDLDTYRSAPSELCALLDQCYSASAPGKCQADVEAAIAHKSNLDVSDWLQSFSDLSCLENCSSARRCLDLPLLCVTSAACSRREDCCGFVRGHTDCEASACCTTRGSACTDNADCCEDAGTCARVGDSDFRTCGGTICGEPNDACAIDADCCTHICKDNLCSDSICGKDSFNCTVDKDCCSNFCDPITLACAQPPTCTKPGEDCALQTDCCADTFCRFAPGTLKAQCSTVSCAFDFVECATDDQCCSGHCDPHAFFCTAACTDLGSTCTGDTDCCTGRCENDVCKGECSTTFCSVGADCCDGACVAGACAAACKPPSGHSPCLAGAPLDDQTVADPYYPCASAVCAADPYCCCGAWDGLCVSAALQQGAVCKSACQ